MPVGLPFSRLVSPIREAEAPRSVRLRLGPAAWAALSASLPFSRQARGRDARSVSAYPSNLLHLLPCSPVTRRCHGGLAACGQRLTGAGQW